MALEAKDIFLNHRDNSPFQSYQDPKKLFPINQYMNTLSIDHLIFINIGILITNRSFASSEGPQSAGPILACRRLLLTRVLRGPPIRWIDLCCMAGGIRLWRGVMRAASAGAASGPASAPAADSSSLSVAASSLLHEEYLGISMAFV